MTVTDITKDLQARTITVTASFDAPVGAVWDLYADPRKLGRWWGPRATPRPSRSTRSSREGPCATS